MGKATRCMRRFTKYHIDLNKFKSSIIEEFYVQALKYVSRIPLLKTLRNLKNEIDDVK